MTEAVRTGHVAGRHDGRTTLEQRFSFPGVEAAAVAAILLDAPLVGGGSVFGKRPGEEGYTEGGRTIRSFSPAPGFRFDVDLTRVDGVFLVFFTQPDRRVPYLQGGFTWTVTDEDGGAVLDEQINTPAALAVAKEPLGGPRPSLRRWLFFRAGHRQVMNRATGNVARLLS